MLTDWLKIMMDEIARKNIPEVWLNPGADGDEVIARARALNIKPIVACSIVDAQTG